MDSSRGLAPPSVRPCRAYQSFQPDGALCHGLCPDVAKIAPIASRTGLQVKTALGLQKKEDIVATVEEIFIQWSKGPDEAEKNKIENTERQIRQAIQDSAKLGRRNIKVFTQGSYRNNVNVRKDSDVDIGVLCFDTFFADYPDTNIKESVQKSFGITDSEYTYLQFKSELEEALVARFGRTSVVRGKKAIDVKESRYRVDADVCPFFEHRRFTSESRYLSGVEMRPDDSTPPRIINWPEQHYENGVDKNRLTERRFKRTVRVLKKLTYEMSSEVEIAKKIPSFLIECLLWNVPNEKFTGQSYYGDLREILIFLYNLTKDVQLTKEWGEVSELKYLFRPSQPWNTQQVNEFTSAVWKYVGYK